MSLLLYALTQRGTDLHSEPPDVTVESVARLLGYPLEKRPHPSREMRVPKPVEHTPSIHSRFFIVAVQERSGELKLDPHMISSSAFL